jgi:hypothetical protein
MKSGMGKTPNVSHLRVWGSKTFAMELKRLQTEADVKHVEDFLVGYTNDAKYVIFICLMLWVGYYNPMM